MAELGSKREALMNCRFTRPLSEIPQDRPFVWRRAWTSDVKHVGGLPTFCREAFGTFCREALGDCCRRARREAGCPTYGSGSQVRMGRLLV